MTFMEVRKITKENSMWNVPEVSPPEQFGYNVTEKVLFSVHQIKKWIRKARANLNIIGKEGQGA